MKDWSFQDSKYFMLLHYLLYRCFYLAKSYSLAGKRAEAYALYSRALSLAENALQTLQSMANSEQVSLHIIVYTLLLRCNLRYR